MFPRLRRVYVWLSIQWFTATLILLAVIFCSALAVRAIDARRRSQHPFNPRALHSMSAAESQELHRAFANITETLDYQPWVGFSERPMNTPRVNIDRGSPLPIRRTIAAPPRASRRVTVWIFGGSTAFGFGVPDDLTIASHLQSFLAAADPTTEVHVVNHAHVGFFSTQELQLFQWLLRSGQRADLAVFIDGLNDARDNPDWPWNTPHVAHAYARSGQVISISRDFAPARLVRMLGGAEERRPESLAITSPAKFADRTVALYRTNMSMARHTAALFGVKTLFVWQPTPFDYFTPGRDPLVQRIHRPAPPELALPLVNARMRASEDAADFLFLAPLFVADGFLDTYLDRCHYGDVASRKFAHAIGKAIVARKLLVTPPARPSAALPPAPPPAAR